MTDLKTEIKQSKPFGSLQEEAHLNIVRTAAMLTHAFNEAIRVAASPARSTTPSGCSVAPASRVSAATRSATGWWFSQVPDEACSTAWNGWASSSASARKAIAGTSPRGSRRPALDFLAELDGPVCQLHRAQIDEATDEELRTVVSVLERIRSRLQVS